MSFDRSSISDKEEPKIPKIPHMISSGFAWLRSVGGASAAVQKWRCS